MSLQNVNWKNLFRVKRENLQDKLSNPYRALFPPINGRSLSEEEIQEIYRNNLAFLETKAESRIRVMVARAEAQGYELLPSNHKVSASGNIPILGKRKHLRLFGYIDPLGKLTLARKINTVSGHEYINALTINYQREECIVHDSFLVAILAQ